METKTQPTQRADQGSAATTASAKSGGLSYLSQISIRTMDQDLNKKGPVTPTATAPTPQIINEVKPQSAAAPVVIPKPAAPAQPAPAPAAPRPAPPLKDQIESAGLQTEKEKIEMLKKEADKKATDSISADYEQARTLFDQKQYQQAAEKLEKVASSQQADWALKWKAKRLLEDSQEKMRSSLFAPKPTEPAPAIKPVAPEAPKISEQPKPAVPELKFVAPVSAAPEIKPAPAAAPVPAQPKPLTPEKNTPAPAPAAFKTAAPPPGLPTETPKPQITPAKLEFKPAAPIAPKPVMPVSSPVFQPQPAIAGGNRRVWLISLGIIFGIALISGGITFLWKLSAGPSQTASNTPSVSFSPSPIPSVAPAQQWPFIMDAEKTVVLAANEKAFSKLQPLFESDQVANSFTALNFKNETGQLNLAQLSSAFDIDLFDLPTQCVATSTCSGTGKLSDFLGDKYSVLAYSQVVAVSSPFTAATNLNHFGLIIQLKDQISTSTEPVMKTLAQVESFMPAAFNTLLSGKKTSQPIATFSSNLYQGIDIRYFNLEPQVSVDYAVVKGSLVFATSKESMFAIIDKLLAK